MRAKIQLAKPSRRFCFAGLLLTVLLQAAAQNYFTDTEADVIKAFLRANLRRSNACIVIGLVDERQNWVFQRLPFSRTTA